MYARDSDNVYVKRRNKDIILENPLNGDIEGPPIVKPPTIHRGVAPIYVGDFEQHNDPSGRTTLTGAYFQLYYHTDIDRYGLQERGVGLWQTLFIYKDVIKEGGFEWDMKASRLLKTVTPTQLGIRADMAGKDLTLRELYTPPKDHSSWWPTEWHRVYWIPLSAISTLAFIFFTEP
jgi:hypothetical protein